MRLSHTYSNGDSDVTGPASLPNQFADFDLTHPSMSPITCQSLPPSPHTTTTDANEVQNDGEVDIPCTRGNLSAVCVCGAAVGDSEWVEEKS